MKRMLVLAAFVAVLAGAGIAYAATSGGGLPGGEPAVWGGGHFDPYFEGYGQLPRDFSIVATPDGGKWVYGVNGSGPRIVGPVTCMRVSGNHAVFGGIIREDPYNAEYVGYLFIGYMTDNGRLAETTPDQVSANFVMEKPDIGWGGITKSFPYVCPAFSAMSSDVQMWDLTGGDLVVQNATQNAQQ
jgi:hypothetical protein